MIVDLSATPFYHKGTGYPEGSPLPWIVSDFGIVDAIESGITKIPRVPVADDSGRPDPKYFHLWRQIMARLPQSERETNKRRAKPDAVWREAQGAFYNSRRQNGRLLLNTSPSPTIRSRPALSLLRRTQCSPGSLRRPLRAAMWTHALSGDFTFAIDSKVLAAAEAAEDGGTVTEHSKCFGSPLQPSASRPGLMTTRRLASRKLARPPGKNVRCVVSVGMLTEGWDART